MLIKRRSFIQVGSLATGTMLVPRFLKAFEQPALVPAGALQAVDLVRGGDRSGGWGLFPRLSPDRPLVSGLLWGGHSPLGGRPDTAGGDHAWLGSATMDRSGTFSVPTV